ncbi:MAG: MarR family transcriptional regulator [Clostridia bacterium]|nr:MarR family transcriptional regulator [Clostridia bacterium]
MNDRYEEFTVLINRISRSIHRIKTRKMACFGLKGAHVSYLYYLYLSEGITASELCEKCAEDKASVSRALDHLEQEGFVFCDSKHEKRYKSPLKLTDKGRAAAEKIVAIVDSVLDETSGVLSEEERRIFYRNLTAIGERLEKIAEGSGEVL